MAHRVRFIGRDASPAQRDAEEHLVERVGKGVRRFGEHSGRPGEQTRCELGSRDEEICGEGDDDGSNALAALQSFQRSARVALRRRP